MAIRILQLTLGPLQTNCYVLACTTTLRAAVIDPAWDGQAILDRVTNNGWTLDKILLTHPHFDHVGGLAELKELSDTPIYGHEEGTLMLSQAQAAAALWSVAIDKPPAVDIFVQEGESIKVGDLQLEVLFTPGHSPGHVSFYLPAHHVLFDGDVLFQGSIGRTDLPGADFDILMASINDKLLTLPDETVVLSGHGPATSIGDERRTNPFLAR